MARSSKKKQQRKAQKRLDASVAELPKGQIPAAVATQPNIPEINNYQSADNYRLIFDVYNHNVCEIDKLNSSLAKAYINKLAMLAKFSPRTLPSSTLVRDKIENNGKYKDLFSGLNEDIDLVEVKYAATGRIVCFFLNEIMKDEQQCNYCCIVTILAQHR